MAALVHQYTGDRWWPLRVIGSFHLHLHQEGTPMATFDESPAVETKHQRVLVYNLRIQVPSEPKPVQNLTASEFQTHLTSVLDRVNDTREAIAIQRSGGRSVVVMDAEDYASIQETLYLVRSPANAERLKVGIAQHREGQRQEIDVTPYLD